MCTSKRTSFHFNRFKINTCDYKDVLKIYYQEVEEEETDIEERRQR